MAKSSRPKADKGLATFETLLLFTYPANRNSELTGLSHTRLAFRLRGEKGAKAARLTIHTPYPLRLAYPRGPPGQSFRYLLPGLSPFWEDVN